MSVSTVLGTPQPQNFSLTYPYLGSHLDQSGKMIIIWLILTGGYGVVLGRVPTINNTLPIPAPYDISTLTQFQIGSTQQNAVGLYMIVPYSAVVSLQNNDE